MAVRYYDEALLYKLKKWIPENSNLRVLKTDETKRLWELTAEDTNDKAFKLPFISLSRDTSIDLLLNVKNTRSFDGITLAQTPEQTKQLNIIPIKLVYQLDIYTKTYEEGDEYLRNFLFKLINNPSFTIEIPYNGSDVKHIANIRVLEQISDTSDIQERLFNGQFTRWTIQLEIQDAFLFNIPFRKNWKLDGITFEVLEHTINDIDPIESTEIEIVKKS